MFIYKLLGCLRMRSYYKRNQRCQLERSKRYDGGSKFLTKSTRDEL